MKTKEKTLTSLMRDNIGQIDVKNATEHVSRMNKNEKLKDAKRNLYSVLLSMGDDLTDSDISLMYDLSKDNQMQEIIQESVSKIKKP